MKAKIVLTAQMLVGLMLIIFGANTFIGFIPMQPGTQQMGMFLGALAQTGYLMSIVGLILIFTGVSFLFNKFVPLMAILLMPVMVNAFLAHLFLDIAGILPASFVLSVTLAVMWKHRNRYASILKV